jgi:dienelactone hydrolase
VREATLLDGGVTVRVQIPPGPPGRRPAVIGSVPDPTALLAAGAVVVTYEVHLPPPAPAAAEQPAAPNTVGVWLLAAPSAKTVGEFWFALIAHQAEKVIPAIVDHLGGVPEVDPARVGVAGISTTGFVALQAVAADRRLRAAAAVSACGAYHTFLHLSNLAMNGAPLDLDPSYDRWLDVHDPVAHPQRLVHAAILMVNGDDDTAVPARCALETGRALSRAYAAADVPERFRLVMLPDANHNIGPSAQHDVMAWWYRWFLRPGSPPHSES